MRTSTRSTTLVLLLVAIVCAALGWATDAWYGRLLHERERVVVGVHAEHSARALEQEVGRRIALLAGWRAFAESYNGDRERLHEDLPVFASGLITGLSGVRALQYVHEGRIGAMWPVQGNEAALGLDLFAHADPRVGADMRRAMRERALTITGPVELVQGGSGLVVRQATALPVGVYPEVATILLDVNTLLADAGLASDNDEFSFAVRDGTGALVAGSPATLHDPVRVAVHLDDGDWTLERAPVDGWGLAAQEERRLLRASALVISLLLIGLASVLAGRQARLRDAVHERTRALQAANHDLALEVDERQAAVRTLRDRAEQLRVALAAGRMGVWGWDLETGRLQWNEGVGELFGLPKDETPSSLHAFLELLSPEDRVAVKQRIRATLNHGEPFNIEHRVVTPDGVERFVYSTAELQVDAASGTRRLLGVIMDVTTRTRLEAQLRQAQKMEAVGTLAGGIAHDFNNLLTAILGFARLAHESLDAASAAGRMSGDTIACVRDDLVELIRAGDRASLLTAQLLAFSRQQVVQSIPVDVNVVVEDLERMLARLLDERIALRTTPSRASVIVRGDPGQLSQVLLNLVVNARDALPAGGAITVATQLHCVERARANDCALINAGLADGEWVELRVSDNGTGMSADVQSRMFEPFYTTKPTGHGTGLGLSTVYGIVSAVGGRILVDSREGVGTTMRIFWPALVGHEAAVASLRDDTPGTRGGETILVVEDEPGVLRLVSQILSRYGYAVRVAENGRNALRSLREHGVATDIPRLAGAISLVISDVVMPEMGGLELAETMRTRYPNVPVLLMSGYPAAGVDEFALGTRHVETPILTKPFSPRDLLEHVRALLDGEPVGTGAA